MRCRVKVKVGQIQAVKVNAGQAQAVRVCVTAPVIGGTGAPYEGEYIVTPKAHAAQVLPTKEKYMLDDVTVLKVPYFETHNDNGLTAYIANEV